MASISSDAKAPWFRTWGAFAFTSALLVLALVVPVAALLIVWAPNQTQDNVSDAPFTLAPDLQPGTVTVAATATYSWQPGVELPAPAWSGLVTAVYVHTGDRLGVADTVARIDGVSVKYFVLESPLYQRVCAGDTTLVSEVRTILEAEELPTAKTKDLSTTDLLSIRKYAKSIGVAGSSRLQCFEPGWIASTDVPIGVVGELSLPLGAPAPPQGVTVAAGVAHLSAIDLVGTSGASDIDDNLTGEGAASFASSELLVNGAPTGVSLKDLASPESLEQLSPLFDPTLTTAPVAVALGLGPSQFIAPATAVVNPTGANACVIAASDEAAIPVTVVASSVSGLIVDVGDASKPTPILIVPGRISC